MKRIRRKILLLGLTAMMSVSLAACGSKEESTGGTSTAATDATTAKEDDGDVTLEVTFDSDAIKSIEIKEHSETPGISDAPIAKIPELIIANQSLKIDAITGATNTSNARASFGGDFINPDGNPGIFEAPFYAGSRTPAAHITKGGLKVNTSAEVIGTDGNVIPGLCAAGEVTGGRTVAGLLEAMTSGRTAGKTVMGN